MTLHYLQQFPKRGLKWERPLVEWARTLVGTPHQFGTTDCLVLAQEAIRVMTGRPFVFDPEITAYHDALGAARAQILAKRRYGSVGNGVQAHGLRLVGPACRGATGDILVWETGREMAAFGIIVGRAVLIADEAQGVHFAPLAAYADDMEGQAYRVP